MRLVLILLLLVSTSPAFANPKLAKERVAAAEKVYTGVLARLKGGTTTSDVVYTWSIRWLDSSLAAEPAKAKQALADHTARMKDLETQMIDGRDKGKVTPSDADAATYFRIEAEYWQARGKK